jgi:flagellar biosynthesis GTPase FlhF
MENFDLKKIETLSPIEARKYIDQYFYILDDGSHAMIKDNEFRMYDTKTIKGLYFNRVSKELQDYYFRQKKDIKTVIYDINKPTITKDELNLCPQVKHKYQPYKDFKSKTQKKVDIMLQNIKEVLCNNEEKIYTHIEKWIANMIKGNKNQCCLYLKGPQGSGKTTPIEFIRYHVLGIIIIIQLITYLKSI